MVNRKRRFRDGIIRYLIYLCASFSVLLLIGIIVYILVKGVRAVNFSFLTSVTSVLKGTVGIAGNIVNTILTILITMPVATPIGVGSAIYLNEYAKRGNRLVGLVRITAETLSGIPSIVYGLFGSLFSAHSLLRFYTLIIHILFLVLIH